MKLVAGKEGETHSIKGREWRCVGKEPYYRKNGDDTELLIWRIKCAKCDSPVHIKTPLHGFERSKAFLAKHCDLHKKTNTQKTACNTAT